MHEWRRSGTRGGVSTGLVYRPELSWIALNPAPHQRSIIVDIAIGTPRYSCPLPDRVEQDAEPATLIPGRIQILIVLRRELVVSEERDGVTWTFPVKLDTGWKDMDRYIGIVPEFHRQDIAREMPGRRRDQGGNAQRGSRRSESLQHLSSPPPVTYRRTVFQHDMLVLVSFPTLGQTCDGLVVCARPALMRAERDRAPSIACGALQRCICMFISSGPGIMPSFRSAMIRSDPTTTRATINTPNASAITLLVLSGPVVTCRKNTRWMPICAIASTVRPRETPPVQSSDVLATQNEMAVRTTARANPIV